VCDVEAKSCAQVRLEASMEDGTQVLAEV